LGHSVYQRYTTFVDTDIHTQASVLVSDSHSLVLKLMGARRQGQGALAPPRQVVKWFVH